MREGVNTKIRGRTLVHGATGSAGQAWRRCRIDLATLFAHLAYRLVHRNDNSLPRSRADGGRRGERSRHRTIVVMVLSGLHLRLQNVHWLEVQAFVAKPKYERRICIITALKFQNSRVINSTHGNTQERDNNVDCCICTHTTSW